MNEEKRLSDLMPQEWATVKRLDTPPQMRRRFLDIGLIEGTRVLCVGKSPANDPSAYLIRGAVIAIRRRDAQTVAIEPPRMERPTWD